MMTVESLIQSHRVQVTLIGKAMAHRVNGRWAVIFPAMIWLMSAYQASNVVRDVVKHLAALIMVGQHTMAALVGLRREMLIQLVLYKLIPAVCVDIYKFYNQLIIFI
jgi:hypothetical protein